jgi:hypothetical protein
MGHRETGDSRWWLGAWVTSEGDRSPREDPGIPEKVSPGLAREDPEAQSKDKGHEGSV